MRKKLPISSFGAALFNALIEGSKRKIEVKARYREAIQFRMRAHLLRARMREESHPMSQVVSRTKLTIDWDRAVTPTRYTSRHVAIPESQDAIVTLTIAPHDSEFVDALSAAGIQTDAPVDLTTDAIPPAVAGAPAPQGATLDDLLLNWKSKP